MHSESKSNPKFNLFQFFLDFYRLRQIMMKHAFTLLLTISTLLITPNAQSNEIQIRVMTFNIWVGGSQGGQPLERTVEAIQVARADIVGMQETHVGKVDQSQRIAEILGWHHLQQGDRTAVLSRYPIVGSTPHKWGVTIELSDKAKLHMFNVHFAASPYQPYQLKNIPYGNAPFIQTSEQAVEWANKARGAQVGRMLTELVPAIASNQPVLLTGDFNEPSFQDWTEGVWKRDRIPVPVNFPATSRVVAAGLFDTYRQAHPDPITQPGHTWTNTSSSDDPNDFHDRIDFVFACGVNVLSSQVVGENKSQADIVLSPWPSDHRAVISTVSMLPRSSQ